MSRVYDIMDWPQIEAVVYSECSNPKGLMGARIIEDGVLVQTFAPDAQAVRVHDIDKDCYYDMELEDEAGYFAAIIPGKKVPFYNFEITYADGNVVMAYDPYSFDSQLSEDDLGRFAKGIHYEIYDKLGAHPVEINGVKGVNFAVWAPNAMRVSVVGDFNMWDGRRHQMQKLGDSGVFEIFVPELSEGAIYRYEIKFRSGDPALKSDPYGNFSEVRPASASIVYDINKFEWSDDAWMKARKDKDSDKLPMSIYEVHLGSWKKPEGGDREFYNYREIAVMLADYVKSMGYTHVELMPVMEHPLDASWGYQVTGYYAPTSRYGTPEDFMYFMNYMHEQGIGVILDWVPAHFPKDRHALADFDGTALYENKDPRRGEHPHWGTLIFDYGRYEVSNFLIANALFWVNKYHADGIRMDAVASMLYLDYGREDGEWLPNAYGGKENLEALELLKHLNSIMKKKYPGVIMVAEESTAWPNITGSVDDGAVGFDYKWNMGWMNDFLSYMQTEPYARKFNHNKLTFSMIYAYSEKFILVLSHDEVVHGKGSMAGKMPGATYELKFANLRAAYLYMMTHPGKKLLFMGQDFGQMDEWNENEGIQWSLLQYDIHRNMQKFMQAVNKLYLSSPALYLKDSTYEGFEWINCNNADDSVVSFVRKSDVEAETIVVVCNFEQKYHESFKVGVPFAGKYKEILNSDSSKFGGENNVNTKVCKSEDEPWDGRDNNITVKLAPLSVAVFNYTPYTEEELEKIVAAKERKRIAEEKKRVAEEKKRIAEEKKRIAEEKRRIAEEKKRAAEERKRIAEEKKRAAEERKRIAEEKKRAAEEKKRASEEKKAAKPAKKTGVKPESKAADVKAEGAKPAKAEAKAKPAAKAAKAGTEKKPAGKTAEKKTTANKKTSEKI
ncbi:MAG: 1,4-alpha-glucan branching protein GlgB [Lachnospiraceae bacterium]|nr:1,4-alpha-glucan branching protein GlgB [Lachnospiraceae bacterium]